MKKKVSKKCLTCKNTFLISKYEIGRGRGKFCSKSCCVRYFKINGLTQKHKDKISSSGKKTSYWNNLSDFEKDKYKKHLSNCRKGSKHYNWKGGISDNNMRLRNTCDLIKWRKSVFTRDNFTCVDCGSIENLNAHHIKEFILYPKLRCKLSNGKTLCRRCHLKYHKHRPTSR